MLDSERGSVLIWVLGVICLGMFPSGAWAKGFEVSPRLVAKLDVKRSHPSPLIYSCVPTHFGELPLKDTGRPDGGDCDHQGQRYRQMISYLRFFPVQVKTSEPFDYGMGQPLGFFWKLAFVFSIVSWVGGGLTVWRGAHIADDFLSGGLVLIGIGLCFMVFGLWLLNKVFIKVNPSLFHTDKQIAVISALAEGSGIRRERLICERETGSFA